MRELAVILATATAACIDPTSNSSTATDSYAPVEMAADVAPSVEGVETIHATVTDVTLRDARGSTIASVVAFEPEGSADEVVGIRVSEAYVGAPLIAVTTTVGGHRESTTYTALYRANERRLERLFVAPVAEVSDDTLTTGSLLVFPGTLLYRAPHAERPALFRFDAAAHEFLPSDSGGEAP